MDYAVFLEKNQAGSVQQNLLDDLHFWETRMKKDSGNFVAELKAASAHLKLFHLEGNVSQLHSADTLLKSASGTLANKDPEILFALSQNSITQHRFKDAIHFNNKALEASGDPYLYLLLEFDGMMEIGNYGRAAKILQQIQDKSDFQYLIRKAKLEDHKGNSDKAIDLMQEALEKIKTKSNALFCWTLSNLGDMYSHSGRVGEAYNAYLEVLKKDNSSSYALKGIAWLAFSNDKNIQEAKRMLNFILSKTRMPDLWLQLAEIEEWNGNITGKEVYINRFIREVTKPEYENMYNKYLILLFCEELKQPRKALTLALKEIEIRATPETYSWLACAYSGTGENQKAVSILQNYVYGKTFEPETLYHMAIIFSKAGKVKEAKELFNQCLSASIELGPVKTTHIREELKRTEGS